MANKTVILNSYSLNGTSGLLLYLLDPDTGAIGNGAGDTLAVGDNGTFTATVTEAITGWWRVVVTLSGVPRLEGGWVYFESDTAGDYRVDDPELVPQWYESPGTVTIAPLSATRPTKVKGSNIETYVGDTDPIRIAIWSGASGTTPVDLEALRPLTLVIADKTSKAVLQTIEDGDLDIDTTNYLTFTPSALAVEEEAIHRWSLRKANGAVIGRGDFGVFWEPIKETE